MKPDLSATSLVPMSQVGPAGDAPVRYWMGVDGGGTGTRVRLCGAQGQVLAEGRAGPSALGQGVEQAWRNIHQAVQAAVQQARLTDFDWAACAIGLGLSGALQRAAADAFRHAAPRCARLVLDSDAWTGLLGAHAGAPGALLIAGTGSVAFAQGLDGGRRQVGGWGWRLGDEGSGAWLGQAALRHTQRALDGRDRRGALAAAVLARVGGQPADLLGWQAQAGQAEFAALAPLVFDSEGADAHAAALLAQAVQELCLLVHVLDPDALLPVACAGSVGLRLAPRLASGAAPCMAAEPGRRRWVSAQFDALAGALHLVRAPCAFQAATP